MQLLSFTGMTGFNVFDVTSWCSAYFLTDIKIWFLKMKPDAKDDPEDFELIVEEKECEDWIVVSR